MVGWISAGWICVRVGKMSKILSKEVEQKIGEGIQKFTKRGGKLGQRVGALQRGGGAGTPLQSMNNQQKLLYREKERKIIEEAKTTCSDQNTINLSNKDLLHAEQSLLRSIIYINTSRYKLVQF